MTSAATGLRTDLRHARLVARTEFRRSLRTARSETNMIVGLGMSALMLLGVTVAASAGAVLYGDHLAAIGEFGRSMLRAGFVSLWVLATIMVAFRVVGETGRVDGEAGILTATSARSVVLGLLLAELYRLLSYLGVPIVVVSLALGVGTADPIVTVAALTAIGAVLAAGLPVGYLAGLVALYLSATVPFVRRNRLKLAAVVMVVYLAGVLLFGDLMLMLADSPLAWYADLLLLALGAGGTPDVAVAALATTVVVVPVAVTAATRTAVATWYADPAATDDGEDDASTLVSGVDELIGPFASRPTVSITRKTLLRARRAPYTLTFAFVPAFASVGYLSQVVRTGEIPASFPVLAAAYAGWGVGSAFTLNPFGDEGPLLPVTLSSGIAGQQFTRGRILAAWLVGLPVAVALVAVAAVAAGVPAWKATGAIVYGTVFSATAPLVSVGIGASFPKFDTRTVLASREAVMPSVFSFSLFLFVLLPLGGPAFLGLTLGGPLGDLAGVSPALVGAGGVALTAVLSSVAGVLSYAYAVRTFDGYSID